MKESVPRLLVIGGSPPGSGCVAEIILRDICLIYPLSRIFCFATVDPSYRFESIPELASIQVCIQRTKHEHGYRVVAGPIGSLTAFVASSFSFRSHVKKLVKEAVLFGRKHKVDKVWMILDTATTIAMGADVASKLGVPLLSNVWDPPESYLPQRRIDRFSRSRLIKQFGKTLHLSEKVAVVSESMQQDYEQYYAANTIIMRHGILPVGQTDKIKLSSVDRDFLIGFAGGLYAYSAWNCLLEALTLNDWKLNGRNVIVRVMGGRFFFESREKANIQYLGWRSISEAVKLLADCDVNYLPYPFESSSYYMVKYGFPTKLSTYAATGRPVFVHAPEYSSIYNFFMKHPIGICCKSLEPSDVIVGLEKLESNEEYYVKMANKMVEMANSELSVENFHKQFAEFVGIKRNTLLTK
jgi:glycosyltransferase involved in cell wall biosynthesis